MPPSRRRPRGSSGAAVRLRFHTDLAVWQASVHGAPWYDLSPKIPPGAAFEFVLGFFLGRVPSFGIGEVVLRDYLSTWAEECAHYESRPDEKLIRTPRGGGTLTIALDKRG